MIVRVIEEHLRSLRVHLFAGTEEQVAFGYAGWNGEDGGTLEIQAVELIPPTDFAFQSTFHLELSPETHARVIKSAFDRQACLVEFHSHRSGWPARFSDSDLAGFEEFVPHVRWRLAGRPYAAVVFHETTLDALAWLGDSPVQVEGVQVVEGGIHRATGLTLSPPEPRKGRRGRRPV